MFCDPESELNNDSGMDFKSNPIECSSANLCSHYDMEHSSFMDERAFKMMQRMGYKNGAGLGKFEQGITVPIAFDVQFDKSGLGLRIQTETNKDWHFDNEHIVVEEKAEWLKNNEMLNLSSELLQSFVKEVNPKVFVNYDCDFCNKDVFDSIAEAKGIFSRINITDICLARARANPFETVGSSIFINRAALKLANIDAATDFMFTSIDKNVNHKQRAGPYYFADVCAGPGGFTEYILWRKKWLFKGFGLTLKDKNDFNLNKSNCIYPTTFEAFYGIEEDGNVCCPDNIKDFKEKVLFETEGKGVHFMTSDGGFSVEGNEDIQEILSKNIYLCQCLVALEVVRVHGHFVTKLFDVFTRFSIGLLYLMYKCFEKVAVIKPNSSRPANAERYFIGYGLKNNLDVITIRQYLKYIADRLWQLRLLEELDILEIFPLEMIKKDENFSTYFINSNKSIGKSQIQALKKIASFCKNPTLVEFRQDSLRKKCLQYWQLPHASKKYKNKHHNLPNLSDMREWVFSAPLRIMDMNNFAKTFSNLEGWHYCPMYSFSEHTVCNIYAAFSKKVYRLKGCKWVQIKNVHLVDGTLLFGEIVKEREEVDQLSLSENQKLYKYSLHVIDALYLGEICLADLELQQRVDLIDTYCRAVNHEFQSKTVRIRRKSIYPIQAIQQIGEDQESHKCWSMLPTLGFNTQKEIFDVNSILFLNTNDDTLESTHIARVIIFLQENYDKQTITFKEIVNYIASKC